MVCAAAEYRTNAVIRECIDDARCAVAALRARAEEFCFNPGRLTVSGGSAGKFNLLDLRQDNKKVPPRHFPIHSPQLING